VLAYSDTRICPFDFDDEIGTPILDNFNRAHEILVRDLKVTNASICIPSSVERAITASREACDPKTERLFEIQLLIGASDFLRSFNVG
jgi:hypothetical protein